MHLLSPESEAYATHMQEMMEEVMHHVTEEEDEAMPEAEKLLSTEKLEELGARMQERKHELESSGLKRLLATAKSIVT
jgi:mevalonate kinase